jgi:threonine/homoserine/homoserine lactone efflux protein
MGTLLGELIPAAIVAAIAPLPITVLITFLTSDGGLGKALAFTAAVLASFAVVGVIALLTAGTDAGTSEKGSAVTGTVIAVLGGLFLWMGIKQLVGAPDPDAPPPKVMGKLDTMSPAGAAVFGVLIALINFKQVGIYLGGISQIVAADVPETDRWVALAILLVVIQIGVIVPILAYLLAPAQATRALEQCRNWLTSNSRVISIVLGLVIGGWFLIKGVTQIAG